MQEREFDCPECGSRLRVDFGRTEKYVRNAVMLGVTGLLAARHGWDSGFVIFLIGFYGCAGLLVYMLFVAPFLPPFLPAKLIKVADPVSKAYLRRS